MICFVFSELVPGRETRGRVCWTVKEATEEADTQVWTDFLSSFSPAVTDWGQHPQLVWASICRLSQLATTRGPVPPAGMSQYLQTVNLPPLGDQYPQLVWASTCRLSQLATTVVGLGCGDQTLKSIQCLWVWFPLGEVIFTSSNFETSVFSWCSTLSLLRGKSPFSGCGCMCTCVM